MIMCFSDTLMETDFSFLKEEAADGVAWVMPVPDPRRFGVAELGKDGWVKRFIEKPPTMENNLAVVGCYYLKKAEDLLAAIETQMEQGQALKNEYFLTDAISLMIERGTRIRVQEVSTWLDTGTYESLFAASESVRDYLGRHGRNIACLEEIALDMGMIDVAQVEARAKGLKNAYGDYLRRVAAECRRAAMTAPIATQRRSAA